MKNCTYTSFIDYVRDYGLCAPMPHVSCRPACAERGGLHSCGLLHYKKWWERKVVDILAGGQKITGIPIFIEKNTIRLVNHAHSYFIPLEKIDYIRTNDGLKF